MELERIPYELSVCRTEDTASADLTADFFFLSRTCGEITLVCRTEDVPAETAARSDGWRAFRVRGVLDFSLTGVLAGLAGVLARHDISIYALSAYSTDYILVRSEHFERALEILAGEGYAVVSP